MKTKFAILSVFALLITFAFTFFSNEIDIFNMSAYGVTYAGLAIISSTEIGAGVVFDKVLEDIPGGAIVSRTRLRTDAFSILPAGTPLYVLNGAAEIVKTALVITGGNATAVRVNKNHHFKVGDVVMLAAGSNSTAITAINTTNADYDVLTIATLGSTPAADDVLIEASAVSTGSSAHKYTPNALNKVAVDISRPNPSVSGVVRATVRLAALAFPLHADHKTALKQFLFN